MPRVVVVIAVRDMESTIDSAVASLLLQTYRDLQVVVVDNGSSDNTCTAVASVQERDARVVFRHCPIPGPFACRNQAMQDLDCEYVAVMDGDDISLPNRLELEIKALSDDRGLAAIGSRFVRFGDRSGFPHMAVSIEDCWQALSLFNPCCHPTLLIRQSALAKTGLYDLSYAIGSDFDLVRRLSYVGAIRNLEEPLLLYRIHSKQITSRKKAQQQRTLFKVLKKHVAYLQNGREPSDAALLLQMSGAATRIRWELKGLALRSIHSVLSVIKRNSTDREVFA